MVWRNCHCVSTDDAKETNHNLLVWQTGTFWCSGSITEQNTEYFWQHYRTEYRILPAALPNRTQNTSGSTTEQNTEYFRQYYRTEYTILPAALPNRIHNTSDSITEQNTQYFWKYYRTEYTILLAVLPNTIRNNLVVPLREITMWTRTVSTTGWLI